MAITTVKEALATLASLGSEKLRGQNAKRGVTGEQFGVMMGDIRKVAKDIKADPALTMELWETGIFEARMLAILLMKPKQFSAAELDRLVRSNSVTQVSDWLNPYVVKKHPDKEALRQQWMADDHPMAARAGWSLTAERIEKTPDGLDLAALLDRIERDLANAAREPQWTMNGALAAIGIHHSEYRERALAIGERLGVYRDYPTPPGCTSPFAPLWIGEMVRRQSAG